MATAELADETDFDGWRRAARAFRLGGIAPADARFVVQGASRPGDLFETPPARNEQAGRFTAPKAFMEVAEAVALHRSADRFDLLYRLLWRLEAEPDLMRVLSDRDVADALERVKNVRRASHKMKAFVRFRRLEDEAGEAWAAWFEPAHRVVALTAPFFQRRYANMRWSILTPDGSAFWDLATLRLGPAATRDMAPAEDEVEAFWTTYYASTFNPARLKVKTMQGEMPRQYWKNLPEAAAIPDLVAAATARLEAMVAAPAPQPNARFVRLVPQDARADLPAEDAVPDSLEMLRTGVSACRRCPLWRDATQGVCGEGPSRADLMIVGEQPGDQEDLAGRPFVGPAGLLLDGALAAARIAREEAFVTNAVKHFKHEPRGKRRLHKTPDAGEVTACRWWLDHERRLVRPRVILALGATAGLAVLGRKPAVMKERGAVIPLGDGTKAVVTVHPSFLLRLPDEDARRREKALFLEDLEFARSLL